MPSTIAIDYANPWGEMGALSENPMIADALMAYLQTSRFLGLIQYTHDFQNTQNDTVELNAFGPLPGTPDSVPQRQINFDSLAQQQYKKSLTVGRVAGKFSVLEYESYINQIRQFGTYNLREIGNRLIIPQMVRTMNIRAMWAFRGGSYVNTVYSDMDKKIQLEQNTPMRTDGSPWGVQLDVSKVDKYSSLGSTIDVINGIGGANLLSEKQTLDLFDEIRLGQRNAGQYGRIDFLGSLPSELSIVLTTPGASYALVHNPKFRSDITSGDPERLITGQMGRYHNIIFVEYPELYMFNCGSIQKQVAITAPLRTGSGAARQVAINLETADNYQFADAQRFVQCSDFNTGDFAIGDRITLHRTRTADMGVVRAANDKSYSADLIVGDPTGVNPFEGQAFHANIVSIDAASNTISLDTPFDWDWTSAVASHSGNVNVYGYLTRGRHISQSICIKGPRAVEGGSLRPPRIVAAPRYDDLMDYNRVTWDWRGDYTVFNDASLETVYSCEPYRDRGALQY